MDEEPHVPRAGRAVVRSYANASGRRGFRLYVPSGCGGQDAVPLLVMLHGGAQTAEDFAAVTRMDELADSNTFLVAYPEQDPSANPGRYWNWFEPVHQAADSGEPSLLAGITRQVMAQFPVDTTRVYVAGFSSGGAMAAILAVTHPELYAAVGVHSGLPFGAARDLSSALSVMRQGSGQDNRPPVARHPRPAAAAGVLPLIVFHGDRDTVVSPANGDALIRNALAGIREAHGSARAPYRRGTASGLAAGGHHFTRSTYQDAAGRSLVEQWTVHGAVHAWSGGSPVGSYTNPRGPDASAEFVRFFLQHTKAAAPAARP